VWVSRVDVGNISHQWFILVPQGEFCAVAEMNALVAFLFAFFTL
jgi:hypothetical protein